MNFSAQRTRKRKNGKRILRRSFNVMWSKSYRQMRIHKQYYNWLTITSIRLFGCCTKQIVVIRLTLRIFFALVRNLTLANLIKCPYKPDWTNSTKLWQFLSVFCLLLSGFVGASARKLRVPSNTKRQTTEHKTEQLNETHRREKKDINFQSDKNICLSTLGFCVCVCFAWYASYSSAPPCARASRMYRMNAINERVRLRLYCSRWERGPDTFCSILREGSERYRTAQEKFK